jgi:hypothetical protein
MKKFIAQKGIVEQRGIQKHNIVSWLYPTLCQKSSSGPGISLNGRKLFLTYKEIADISRLIWNKLVIFFSKAIFSRIILQYFSKLVERFGFSLRDNDGTYLIFRKLKSRLCLKCPVSLCCGSSEAGKGGGGGRAVYWKLLEK